jgi:hypothetical protein
METIVEFLEDHGDGFGTHHTLSWCDDAGIFILEAQDVSILPCPSGVIEMDSQEAFEWATEYAGMDPVEAARRIIGADQDTPR